MTLMYYIPLMVINIAMICKSAFVGSVTALNSNP